MKEKHALSTYLQPLVDASGVKFMRTGQNAQVLLHFKVTHANDTHRLITLVIGALVLVRGQLINLLFGEATRFRLAQSLGQTKQSLVVFCFRGILKQWRHTVKVGLGKVAEIVQITEESTMVCMTAAGIEWVQPVTL